MTRCSLCDANPASPEAQFCDLPGCPLTAPAFGTDRASGSSKDQPAPDRRQRRGVVAEIVSMPAKVGNGAPHFVSQAEAEARGLA